MNESEMRARLAILEVLTMTAFGIVFALSAETDPHHQRAIGTLDAIKAAAKIRLLRTTDDGPTLQAGDAYLDELLSTLSENLHLMRPK